MEDFQAFAVVQGKALVDEALAAPKSTADAGRDAHAERGVEAMTHIIQLPMLHTNLGLVSQAKCPVCGASTTFMQETWQAGCPHATCFLVDPTRTTVKFWFRQGD